MNIPEEKAKELVDKFRNELSWIEKDYPVDLWRDAKQCALICVDEIITTLNSFADYWDLKRGEWYKDELAKIEKVKEEIQKLI